ncbi:MAG: hypothetical protein ACR2PZ_15930 [Pseudomonadales bacterium]
MTKSDTAATRFERKPWVAWLMLCALFAGFVELTLRLVNPDILRFAYEFRQVYRYHDRWYTDFEPSSSSVVRLSGDDGYVVNFLLTVNAQGFRFYDQPAGRQRRLLEAQRYVHLTGDSFAMGWGVNYESSLPAQLEGLLATDTAVLNLGLNGFGAIAATEKSAAVAQRFPPAHVIYLATQNDYADDEQAHRYAQLPAITHSAMVGVNWLRQHTYVASAPFAMRWWLYYRKAFDRDAIRPIETNARPKLLPIAGEANSSLGIHSKRAIRQFADRLSDDGVPFTVVAHGINAVSEDIVRFCRQENIATLLIDVPEELKLVGDGHFNAAGNKALARLLLEQLQLSE